MYLKASGSLTHFTDVLSLLPPWDYTIQSFLQFFQLLGWQSPLSVFTIYMIYVEGFFFLFHNMLLVLLPVMNISSLDLTLRCIDLYRFLFCGFLCVISSLQMSFRMSHCNYTLPARCFFLKKKTTLLSSYALHLVILSTFIVID